MQAAVNETLEKTTEYMLDLEDQEGRIYTGRLTGQLIAYDERTTASVFLTTEERVILHNPDKLQMWEIEYPVEELRDALDEGPYIDAMNALGLKAIVDL